MKFFKYFLPREKKLLPVATLCLTALETELHRAICFVFCSKNKSFLNFANFSSYMSLLSSVTQTNQRITHFKTLTDSEFTVPLCGE